MFYSMVFGFLVFAVAVLGVVGRLNQRIAQVGQRAEAAEERCKRLMAPVSQHEAETFTSLCDRGYVFTEDNVDALLAERGKGKP